MSLVSIALSWRKQSILCPNLYSGTEINGELSVRFERICGHKGYSYDAYDHNNREDQWVEDHPTDTLFEYNGDEGSLTELREGYNRGRVQYSVMKEIGWADCDWCSMEQSFDQWYAAAKAVYPAALELHVPCREPIGFLYSMCNYRCREIDCNASQSELLRQVDECLTYMNRFDDQAAYNWDPNVTAPVTLKCFDPIPIDPYIDYMATKLQPRRFVRSYVHRETNLPHDKKQECLRYNEGLRATVTQYLTENVPIFRFCKGCVGTKDDLLRKGNHN